MHYDDNRVDETWCRLRQSHSSNSLRSFVPVILAGGSGTRFWPRSRRTYSKQLLTLVGERTMLQQSVDRLLPLSPAQQMWAVANEHIADVVRQQIPELQANHLLCEPVPRNTAPAAGLVAFLLERSDPNAVLGIFPSDHAIGDEAQFLHLLAEGAAVASRGESIVVLGIPPNRPETGYGYIEIESSVASRDEANVSTASRVQRFTEKPDRLTAERFLQTGRFLWNSGIFLWSARTLCDAMREYMPATASLLERIATAHHTDEFAEVFSTLYPQCENVSLDYGILEPRSRRAAGSNIFCLEAQVGWNDLGSWSALHEHRCAVSAEELYPNSNVVENAESTVIDSTGNYIFSSGRHTALVGVHNLVVVVTEDAVLVTTRDRAQDVGLVVKRLQEIEGQQLT